MNISIRKFLLVNLLLAMTVTTSLTAIGNYYLDRQDIQVHLDTTLSQAGLSFQALLGEHLKRNNLDSIQESLDKVPELGKIYSEQDKQERSYNYGHRYEFQLWDKSGKLLLHSPKAPNILEKNPRSGFSDRYIENELWRVFTIVDEKTGHVFVISEPYGTRNQLAHLITEDDIYIMLITYPLSGLLIWLIIGRGLASVRRVASEVAHRAPHFLEPVDIKAVPIEIKPLVDELNQLFVTLQDAFEREKRFAADAAHELRTPLAGIKTQAQVALRTQDSAERQHILQNVISGVDRSTHVVQQLLTLSRLVPEVNVLEDCTYVNLPKLAAEVIGQLAPSAIEKDIDIELVAPDQQATVYGNLTALGVLIRNLVDNAIRYTPAGGAIRVTVILDLDHVILEVLDNGPGIPAELRSRVFERFYRVLGSKSPGSGLGLAIVRQITVLHNAEITLDAAPTGSGLKITVKFPLPDKKGLQWI